MTSYVLLILTLAASPYRPVPGADTPVARSVPSSKPPVTSRCATSDRVAQLPFAHGRAFCSLDDYLAHLEHHAAPIDQPWWKEIRPGVYRHMTTATNARPETATRADLLKRFRFKR